MSKTVPPDSVKWLVDGVVVEWNKEKGDVWVLGSIPVTQEVIDVIASAHAWAEDYRKSQLPVKENPDYGAYPPKELPEPVIQSSLDPKWKESSEIDQGNTEIFVYDEANPFTRPKRGL